MIEEFDIGSLCARKLTAFFVALMLLPAFLAVVHGAADGDAENSASVLANKPAPDLIVYNMWWSPADPIAGQSTTIYVTIKNSGAKDIKHTSFSTELRIDGVQVVVRTIEDLSAGSYYSFTKTATLTSGTHTLKATVDVYDDVTEKYETNNVRTEYVTAIALPDVAVVDIWTTPSPPIAEQRVIISFTISFNEVPFTETIYTRLYIDGEYKYGVGTPGSGGASEKTSGCNAYLDSGYHELKVITDATGVLTESSETNNERIETIYWQAPTLPNVRTGSFSLDPSPVEGVPTTISFTIYTNSVPFTQTVYTRLYIDNVLKVTKLLYGSTGSNTYTYTYTTTQTAGVHYLEMITDATNVLTESSETDNEYRVGYTWAPSPLPDVSAVDIWTDPSPPTGGQTATVYFSISTSAVPFTETVYTRLYIDDVLKTTKSLAGSSGSDTHTYTYSTTQSIGNHVIRMVTDATGVLTESYETNNERTETIEWQSLPDVYAVDIWTDPSPPTGGQGGLIYFSISTTSIPFTQTIYTYLYIDGVFEASKSLAGSSGAATYTYADWTTQSGGSHTLRIVTDATGVLAESSETNNERTETIAWAEPDSDGDGLTDSYETSIGTNPNDPDTDDDGWNDGNEVLKYYTNPLSTDTDGDGYSDPSDYDPLQDLYVYVKILEIWELDSTDADYVIFDNPADFYWEVTIGSTAQSSGQTDNENQYHLYPNWVMKADVPDNDPTVDVRIVLRENDLFDDDTCDISVTASEAELVYDLRTGDWSGEDCRWDLSGYGRVSGHDDGSWGSDEDDCEVRFMIYQRGYSSDTDYDWLTYREEVNTYLTSPKVNDINLDRDGDDMPLWWEDANGLNDNSNADKWEDPDGDGIYNIGEYLFRDYGCMIDYPDVLVEVDYYPGLAPHQEGLDYIVHYFANRKPPQDFGGTHVYYWISDEVPESRAGIEVDDGEFDAIKEEFMDYEPDFQNDIWGWRYCLVWFAYADWIVGGLSYESPGWEMVIAHGNIDLQLVVYGGYGIWVANCALTTVMMHELGHNCDVIQRHADGSENVCDVWTCVMSYAQGYDPTGILFESRKFCDTCWSLLDVGAFANG